MVAPTRLQLRFNNFKKALLQYQSAVNPHLSVLEKEGVIQRFEYTFELAWKCLQDLLVLRGYSEIRGPRPSIEKAFEDGLIQNGALWLEMLQSRNETTHLYDEATFVRASTQVLGPYLVELQRFSKIFFGDFEKWTR